MNGGKWVQVQPSLWDRLWGSPAVDPETITTKGHLLGESDKSDSKTEPLGLPGDRCSGQDVYTTYSHPVDTKGDGKVEQHLEFTEERRDGGCVSEAGLARTIYTFRTIDEHGRATEGFQGKDPIILCKDDTTRHECSKNLPPLFGNEIYIGNFHGGSGDEIAIRNMDGGFDIYRWEADSSSQSSSSWWPF